MSTSEDWELLTRWCEGDERAGNALLTRYFDPLSRFFRNKVRSDEDAADLVGDTLLACTRNRAAIRDVQSFRSYLFGIAHRQLLVYYRASNNRARVLDDFRELCVAELSGPPSPSTLLGRRAETQLLLRALRSLSLDYQIVLELNFFEGLNGREIGELLGWPTATVHTRLRRGRQQLGALLEALAETKQLSADTIGGLETWARELREEFALGGDPGA